MPKAHSGRLPIFRPQENNGLYSDLKKIMASFGYVESNKGATSGSRVRFYNKETGASMMLHKPHPGDEMVKGAVESVVTFLREHGHI